MIRVLRRTARAAVGVVILAVAPAASATLHNRLTKSEPEKDQRLTTSPNQIRLWFAEPPEAALSGITLLRADSSKVPVGKVAKTDDPLSIRASVPEPLPAGGYLVQWRASGKDGHVIRGSFPFAIAP